MPASFRPPGYKGKAERDKEHDQRRRQDSPWRAWYSRKIWRQAREHQLREQPLCERCQQQGLIVSATVVNHRRPHRGDWSLFIDPSNRESVCATCHNSVIQREERAGRPPL